MGYITVIGGSIFLLDRLVKLLITNFFIVGDNLNIIPNFFSLSHVHNTGAAWSMFEGNRIFLITVTVIFLIAIYHFFIKEKDINKIERFSYGLLIGGILGNLFDRIFLGYVIDYLAFNIFGYNFPIFNLADSCIVIAVFLIIIDTWKGTD